MYFYAIITGTEYDLQYPYPEVTKFLSEFEKPDGFRKFFIDEKKAREEFKKRFKDVSHTIRLREYEEDEMTMCSQIIEVYEYEINDSTLRSQLVKFKTWDD